MSDFIGGIVLGAVLGYLVGFMYADYTPGEVIAICEKQLPRTQNCVLTAKPAQEGDE